MVDFKSIWDSFIGVTQGTPAVTTTTTTKTNWGLVIGGVVITGLLVWGVIAFLKKEG